MEAPIPASKSLKSLPDIARDFSMDLGELIELTQKSGMIHGRRAENLTRNPRLVTLTQEEIQRLQAAITQQQASRPSGDAAKGHLHSRRSRRSERTSEGVVVVRRRRRAASAAVPAAQEAPQPEQEAKPPAAAVPVPQPEAQAEPGHKPGVDTKTDVRQDKPESVQAVPPSEAKAAARKPQPKKVARKGAPERGEDGGEKAERKPKSGRQILTVTDEKKNKIRRHRRSRPTHTVQVQPFKKPAGRVVRDVELPETISLQVLAQRMAVKATDIVTELFKAGTAVTINSVLDQETAALIVHVFEHNPILTKEPDFQPELTNPDGVIEEPRPPVVTVMGHVDHGKTSLLDRIRSTKVAASEAGGITQHMGAYRVDVPKGRILFLDTPGHELFTEMRARGAKVTDIIVLVVAADDGVMPQTEEAINHAKAANVPVVVALNKIDKPGANPDKVIEQLAARGVAPENWGGDNIFVRVSAVTGEGIAELLDSILLQAEILELKASVNVPAHGVAIEAHTDKGRGHVVTMIAKGGELREGTMIVCDTEFGRVRTMLDENGNRIREATASTPFVVQGLSGLPSVGSDFYAVDSEKRAREIVEVKRSKARDQKMAASMPVAITDIAALMQNGGMNGKQVLNVIVKADVYGTLEAITQALRKVSNNEAEIRIIHQGIGGITTSDVNLAHASMARIVAFNVRPDSKARKLIESWSVPTGYYSVIYEATDDLRKSLSDMLEPALEEKLLGTCKVLKVFNISKVGKIAGCRVDDGVVTSKCKLRVVRDGTSVYEGDIGSLRHFKDEVGEIKSGLECGIQMKRFQDFKEGDTLEAFEVIETPREFVAVGESAQLQ